MNYNYHMDKKVVSTNRKAFHDYLIFDKFIAGIVLTGTEIKSIRQGRVQFKDAYISFINHEAYIKEMHISAYDHGNRFNHDETRERKLLLHKIQIMKLENKVKLKGYTIVPVRLYLSKGRAKLEIALAKGKDNADKREAAKKRDAQREIEKAMKNSY